jgi:hypothetical protein
VTEISLKLCLFTILWEAKSSQRLLVLAVGCELTLSMSVQNTGSGLEFCFYFVTDAKSKSTFFVADKFYILVPIGVVSR